MSTNGLSQTNGKAHDPPKKLDASRAKFVQSSVLNPVPKLDSPELWEQNKFCDHMVSVRWTSSEGWEAPQIKPYGNISISPAASCLHYATQCFEGLKVYRGFDGKLRLFRPDRNAGRLSMSSERVSLPRLDDEEVVKLIKALVQVDCPRWLPKEAAGHFLYIRPAMIGNGSQIGIQIPSEATLLIIMAAWPDFSSAVPSRGGLRLFASGEGGVRAWPGGFGYAKIGANYGPSFSALSECRKKGYDQVLWLLGSECRVTEAGSSNFFVIIKNTDTGEAELITPPVTDKIILEGVTRQSVIDLVQSRLSDRVKVVEKDFTMFDLQKAWREGRILESFVSGTAYFITPVSVIHFEGQDWDIPVGPEDIDASITRVVKQWLKDIMYGAEDHEWGVVVDEK